MKGEKLDMTASVLLYILVLSNVRGRDCEEESGSGAGEKPVMTKRVRKDHKS